MQGNKSLPSIQRTVLENIAVAAVLFASVAGMRAILAGEGSAISPIWPAPGIALAAALLFGLRVLPGLILALAGGSFASGNSWLFSLFAPIGVVGFVFFGRALLAWKRMNVSIASTRDVLLLAGLGAVLPMGFAGFWTAGCLWAAGRIGPEIVPAVGAVYWVANTAGTVVVAPAILLLAAGRFSPRGAGEAVATGLRLAVVFLASWVVFFKLPPDAASGQAFAYLPFLFILWVALSRGLGGAAIAVLGVVGLAVAATSSGVGPFVSDDPLRSFWQIEVFIAVITSGGLLIGAGADAQRRERLLQAEAATRKAELERLKAQVNPHFLFNCLTAIQSLIRTDSGAAEQGLTSLSSLLRRSLDVAKHPLIPLAEELEIIREALRLQKMRYEEGLEWSVGADKEAENFRVPPMLLQPLVENAVKHGVDDGFGRVDLTAVIEAGDLVVRVRNTAPKGSDPAAWKESVGLASVRARIAEACPEGSGVEFSKTADGWIEALVRIKPVVGGKMK